jgi:DNA-binding MarR family transcriptional regulator
MSQGLEQQVDRFAVAKCMECTCLHLRKAARAVTQLFDEKLKPSGLRAGQFGLLAAIRLAGGVTINRLARELAMDRTTLTRNLKPLETQGLIAIEPGQDQRTRLVRLTERGHAALKNALPFWQRAQADIVKRLGDERWRALLADLSATVSLMQGG